MLKPMNCSLLLLIHGCSNHCWKAKHWLTNAMLHATNAMVHPTNAILPAMLPATNAMVPATNAMLRVDIGWPN